MSDNGAFDLTEELKQAYPPELHPVLQRHGGDLVGYCCTIMAVNSSLQFLGPKVQHVPAIADHIASLALCIQNLSTNVVRCMSWQGPQITECITDLARAHALASASPNKGKNGLIILS